jgi:integrase
VGGGDPTSGFPATSAGVPRNPGFQGAIQGAPSLAAALARAEIAKPVTFPTFRHAYAAARLHTTEHGAPVSPDTVMRELDYTSLALIERTYGHLSRARHRARVVEYRGARVLAFAEGTNPVTR